MNFSATACGMLSIRRARTDLIRSKMSDEVILQVNDLKNISRSMRVS
jgi:hypothetical protein